MNPFDSYMLNKVRRLILLRQGYGGQADVRTRSASMLAQDAQLGKL